MGSNLTAPHRVITDAVLSGSTVTGGGPTDVINVHPSLADKVLVGIHADKLINGGTKTFTIRISGRMHPDMGWISVATVDESAAFMSVGTDRSYSLEVDPFPEMRVEIEDCTGQTADSTVNIWMMV
jgi:hypothetical protein